MQQFIDNTRYSRGECGVFNCKNTKCIIGALNKRLHHHCGLSYDWVKSQIIIKPNHNENNFNEKEEQGEYKESKSYDLSWSNQSESILKSLISNQKSSREMKMSKMKFCDKIQSLNLSSCNIMELDIGLMEFKQLKFIDLNCNAITKLQNLPMSLQHIRAIGNRINCIEMNENSKCIHLELGFNLLENIQFLSHSLIQSTICSLDLSFNQLCNLNDIISTLKCALNLKNLKLYGNPIELLPNYRHLIISKLDQINDFDSIHLQNHPTIRMDCEEILKSKLNFEKCKLQIQFNDIQNLKHPLNIEEQHLLMDVEPSKSKIKNTNANKKMDLLQENQQRVLYKVEYYIQFRVPNENGKCTTTSMIEGWSNDELRKLPENGFLFSFQFIPSIAWRNFIYFYGLRFLLIERLTKLVVESKNEVNETNNESTNLPKPIISQRTIGVGLLPLKSLVEQKKTSNQFNSKRIEMKVELHHSSTLFNENQWLYPLPHLESETETSKTQSEIHRSTISEYETNTAIHCTIAWNEL